MPLIKSSTPEGIARNIREMQAAGHPHAQAVAAALHTAHPKGYAGGGMSFGMENPWFERRAFENSSAPMAYHPGGLYPTPGGGRTDNIANMVPAGAYIVPADVVSGLGEGNTLAGSAIMDKMFHSDPHGIQSPKLTHGRGVGIPSAPRAFNESSQPYAKGGHTDSHVPIVTAGGEYMVRPEALIKKFGNLKRAHKVMDEFVKHYRQKTAKTMMNLPGPK